MPSKATWLEILKPFPEIEIGDARIVCKMTTEHFDFVFLDGKHCRLAYEHDLPVDELPLVTEIWYDDLALWWSAPHVGMGAWVRSKPSGVRVRRGRLRSERCYIFPWQHLISITRIEFEGWETLIDEDTGDSDEHLEETDESSDGDDTDGTDDSLESQGPKLE